MKRPLIIAALLVCAGHAQAQTYTIVQSHYNTGQASGTSHTCTLSSTVTVGNVVTVGVVWQNTGRTIGTGGSAPTDTLGNTWAVDANAINVGIRSIGFVSSKITTGGASTTITVNVAGGPSGGGNLFCEEWSASTGWPATWFDEVSTGATATGTAVDSSAVTTDQNNELILGPLFLGNARTMTWDSGITQTNPSPDSSNLFKYAYDDVNTAGSNTIGGDLSSSTSWYFRIAAYKATAPAGGPTRKLNRVVIQ